MAENVSGAPTQEQLIGLIREVLGWELATAFIDTIKMGWGKGGSFPTLGTLYHSWPGAGKTQIVTDLAQVCGTQFPTLVLGLSHKSFKNVTREGWAHWKGHDSVSKGDARTCAVNIRASRGYRAEWADCTCDEGPSIRTGGPTFAPVEYVLADTPTGDPLGEEVYRYALWVLDEVDFAKFVGKMVVTRRDVEVTAEHHPSKTVQWLAQALLEVMRQHTAVNKGTRRYQNIQNWYGAELYKRLDAALKALGSPLYPLDDSWPKLAQLSQDSLPTDADWTGEKDAARLPCNFAPRLAQTLRKEVLYYLAGAAFNPLVQLVWDRPEPANPQDRPPVQSLLRINWRKHLAQLHPDIIVLDASADPELLAQVFRPIEAVKVPEPPYPPTVRVHQLVGERVTKSTLGIGPGGGTRKLPPKWRKLLQGEMLARGTHKADGTPRKIGIITFKNVVDDCKAALVQVGYSADHIVTGWYYNLRGDNDFTDCDILVVLGYPIPNPQGLYEEACALYQDDPRPIVRDQQFFDDDLHLRNGYKVKVEGIRGYQDDRLHRLYLQKSRWELYQAFHRSRPLLRGDSGGVTEVLVFTDVPIHGVPVDGFLDIEGKIFSCLERLLKENGKAPVQEVADALLDSQSGLSWTGSRDSLVRRIKREVERGWLCEATGSTYVVGRSKTEPGTFWTAPTPNK